MSTLSEFKNEPLTDFTNAANRAAMDAALQKVRDEFGTEYPLVIGGERITGLKTFESINPAHKGQLLGRFQRGSRAHVEQAIDAAWKAFDDWKRQPVDVRAGLLLKAAALVRERKHEFSATMIYEAGKTWPEADAHAAEQPITKVPGEENELVYIPLGVVAVIRPWNFPFAIMAGRTSAGVVTGNCVVL